MTMQIFSEINEDGATPLYRALAANLTGAAIFVLDSNLRYVLADGPVLREIGKSSADFEGKTVAQVYSPEQARVAEANYRQALAGQPFQHQHHQNGRDYATFGTPLRNHAGEVYAVMAVSYDITERKQREASNTLLVELAEELSRFAIAEEIMHAAGEKLGRFLKITHCLFAEVNEAQDIATVRYRWHAQGAPDMLGEFRLSEYVAPGVLDHVRAGETIVIDDTQTDERVNAAQHAALVIHAFVTVPFHSNGIFKHFLTLNAPTARHWRKDEVDLIREVTHITFLRIERARAEEALQVLNEQLEMRVLERTEALRQSHTQLRELSTHMETTREDERTRIAREVHDELGGHLTALKIEVGSLAWGRDGDEALTTRVNELKMHIDEIVQIVRRIGSDLRPPVLDDYGLIPALEWHGREWARRTGIACQLDLVEDKPPLSREKRTAVFRVFQEALTNVARHAHATAVNVTMAIHSGELALVIEDNGIGIQPDVLAFSRSLGLKGMQERLMEVGGSVEVEGQPGQGTVVAIRVPV